MIISAKAERELMRALPKKNALQNSRITLAIRRSLAGKIVGYHCAFLGPPSIAKDLQWSTPR